MPEDIEEWVSLAKACRTVSRHAAAAAAWREAVRLDPDNPKTRHSLVSSLIRAEKLDAAVEAAMEKPDVDTLTWLAWRFFNVSDYARGYVAINKAIELDPENDDLRNALGSRYLIQGRLEEALEAYERSLAIKADSPGVLVAAAKINLYLGSYEGAKPHLDRLLALGTAKPDDLYALAQVLETHGRLDEALRLVRLGGHDEKMRELESKRMRALAERHWKLGEYKEALEAFPKTTLKPLQLVLVLTMGGRKDEAVEGARALSREQPYRPFSRSANCTRPLDLTCWREALDVVVAAAEAHPETAEAAAVAGLVSLEVGMCEEAADWLKKAALAAPSNADIRLDLARVLIIAGKPDEAVEELEAFGRLAAGQMPEAIFPDLRASLKALRSVARDETSADLYAAVGRVCLAEWDAPGAVEAFAEAVTLAGDDVQTRVDLATLLCDSGDKAGAMNQWRALRELDPKAAWGVMTMIFKVRNETGTVAGAKRAGNAVIVPGPSVRRSVPRPGGASVQ
jgi:tetratricopeptide (TPR) repeat protein